MNTFFTDKNGNPIFVTGLQAHNSSTGTDLIDKTMDAIELYGGNTIEAPVYWYEVEPEKDQYDMTFVKNLIDKARSRNLYLVILWFGVNKNGHPNYAPDYFKLDPDTYRLCIRPDGGAAPSISVHCKATLDRDLEVFTRLVQFVKDYDQEEKTVIAIQIENEFGYGGTDRDYSDEANEAFKKPVPEELRSLEIEGAYASKKDSSWIGTFGRRANEAFSAYYHATFVEALAKAGKEIYEIPFYVNIALGEKKMNYPGLNYNAGAAVPRMIDLWKIAAPHLDLVAPDIYLPDLKSYTSVSEKYDRKDNALFIPETGTRGDAFSMDIILAAGKYHAVGICGFGAESTIDNQKNLLPEARKVAYSMRAISNLSPLLIKYRNTGNVHAFVQEEFTNESTIILKDYAVTARFVSDPQMRVCLSNLNLHTMEYEHYLSERGRGIMVQTGEDEFYLAGSGLGLEFLAIPDPEDTMPYVHASSRMSTELNYLSVEEGHFEGDKWVCDYMRCGDEANYQHYVFAGQVIRIRLNPKKHR